ncbi:acetate--CoA ligase family protein [Jhaorihella thermophila]|uniref:Acetyl-CoA synthetase n=1 Tax=Jhaorihella thermophila TaxID=488547 RepID=A0A1H5VL32_9RHOB|nr:acetate--CoA ligase family protein [Jhaorihella thermophila]SEF87541.1 acetyl-CoA synthetase [Jhaorihella thermophila]
MKRDLSRLLHPRSMVVIGGGAWCEAIIGAARRIGYEGAILPVHPSRDDVAGLNAVRRVEDCRDPVDVAFVGINRHATVEAVAALRGLGAGGAVCFASGFTEATAEDGCGPDLQARLVEAAGEMPILGPNCYGFVNALDRVAVWPDQHGMKPVTRGVAIVTQSSNIAINLTMQRRALPIAYMITCGNMAQTSQAEIAESLLDDDRVTAIGLHVEGFGNLRRWESLAAKAARRGVPLVALKIGRSEQAQAATVSHTASLAGSDAGAQAFLDRLGITRLHGLPEFLETLKLLHCEGRLASNRVASISCSGGEASLVSDMAVGRDLVFPPVTERQRDELRAALGPMVALANPLDYHTYVWRDEAAMARAWRAMTGDGIGLTLSVVDYPHTDRTDWDCATGAALRVRAETGAPFAVVSSLPELMPEEVAERLLSGGVVPLAGLHEALSAIEAAARVPVPETRPALLPGTGAATETLTEVEAKAALAVHGLRIPRHAIVEAEAAGSATVGLKGPFAVKGVGLAHKSDHGAVRLGIDAADVGRVARGIGTPQVLIEELVSGGVAELLIGVTRDPAHGFVLTLGAGGVLTEVLRDTVSLLVPSGRSAVRAALIRLRYAPVLQGFRGKPAADLDAICDAVDAVQNYVVANADAVGEVEINPLICLPDGAVAVDALIRRARKGEART